MSDECERITAYLTGGGLFNPEFANHDAVRDLLIDCRAAIAAAPSDRIAGLERENVALKTKCAMLSGALRAAAQEPSHQSTQLAEMILSDCGFSSNYTPLLNRVAARIDAHVERCLESKKTTQQEAQEPSPTAGMNIAQRILHVGGRNPPGSTYVEFGSIQAVEALVKHVLRDLQPSPAAQVDALDAACQRACMELPEGMSMAIQLERDAGWIELHGSYGDQIELPNADGSLAEQVHQAIDAAITAARARLEDKS